MHATIGKTTRRLNLYVVDDNLDTPCGRERIIHFASDINFSDIFAPHENDDSNDDTHFSLNKVNNILSNTCVLNDNKIIRLQRTIDRYKEVFAESAGKLTGPPITVHKKPDATPIFSRAREVPLALKDAYAKEIDAKIAAGVYERVEFSEWASTTHVVTKKKMVRFVLLAFISPQ